MNIPVKILETNLTDSLLDNPLFETGKAGPNILQVGDLFKDGAAVTIYGMRNAHTAVFFP